MRRLLRFCLLAGLLVPLSGPPAAVADLTASVSGTTLTVTGDAFDDRFRFTYEAGTGGGPSQYRIDAFGTITAGAGCAQNGFVVTCDDPGGALTNVNMNLGNGSDLMVAQNCIQ